MSKKSAKSQKEQSTYEYRDIVLAKVRGYPPWPGMVVDPDSVPPHVSKERPGSKKTSFYCVRFFPAGDYAWLVPKDISKLQIHEIEAYISEPYKRSGDLLSGYRIALDPKKWEEELEQAGFEAGEAEANAEIDQLDSEGGNDSDKKVAKSKKRKRESEAGHTKSKMRIKIDKGSRSERRTSGSKGKRNGNKSKAMVESEDDGDHGDGDGPSKNPPSKKAKRDKDEDEDSPYSRDPEAVRVRDWRHKLQKTFLSNKGLPKQDDMAVLDTLFTTVETYEQMNIQYLQFSKIGKVMRHIAALAPEMVPRDNEFNFRNRAVVLVEKWHQILSSANKPNGADAPTNGTKVDGEHEVVTERTAAIDLNGNPDAVEPTKNDEAKGDTAMAEA